MNYVIVVCIFNFQFPSFGEKRISNSLGCIKTSGGDNQPFMPLVSSSPGSGVSLSSVSFSNNLPSSSPTNSIFAKPSCSSWGNLSTSTKPNQLMYIPPEGFSTNTNCGSMTPVATSSSASQGRSIPHTSYPDNCESFTVNKTVSVDLNSSSPYFDKVKKSMSFAANQEASNILTSISMKNSCSSSAALPQTKEVKTSGGSQSKFFFIFFYW